MGISNIDHHINGQRAAGTSGRSQSVTNPATGAVTGSVQLANGAEVAQAVAAAHAAFAAWANWSRNAATEFSSSVFCRVTAASSSLSACWAFKASVTFASDRPGDPGSPRRGGHRVMKRGHRLCYTARR